MLLNLKKTHTHEDVIIVACYCHHHCVQDIWTCMPLVMQYEIMILFIWEKDFYWWIKRRVIALFTASTHQFCQNPLNDIYFFNVWKVVFVFLETLMWCKTFASRLGISALYSVCKVSAYDTISLLIYVTNRELKPVRSWWNGFIACLRE
jgi:hypothetical protein